MHKTILVYKPDSRFGFEIRLVVVFDPVVAVYHFLLMMKTRPMIGHSAVSLCYGHWLASKGDPQEVCEYQKPDEINTDIANSSNWGVLHHQSCNSVLVIKVTLFTVGG